MNWVYYTCKTIAKITFKVIFGVKEYGLENIPKEGPFIIAANHTSYLDPPLIGALFPHELIFAAKKELFAIPILKQLITNCNAIPIDRKRMTLGSFKLILKKVNQDKKSLLIFPEGTRKHDQELESGKRGIGLFVQKTGVPVIPIYIMNTQSKWKAFFRLVPMAIYFGKPIDLNKYSKKDKESTQKILNEVLEEIKKIKDNMGQK